MGDNDTAVVHQDLLAAAARLMPVTPGDTGLSKSRPPTQHLCSGLGVSAPGRHRGNSPAMPLLTAESPCPQHWLFCPPAGPRMALLTCLGCPWLVQA